MNFGHFKKPRPNEDWTRYRNALVFVLQLLETGLRKITIKENFEGFVVDGLTIEAGAEVAIPNTLNFVPNYRIILRQRGGGTITDGTSDWSVDNVYLQNTGTDATEVSVAFMR